MSDMTTSRTPARSHLRTCNRQEGGGGGGQLLTSNWPKSVRRLES